MAGNVPAERVVVRRCGTTILETPYEETCHALARRQRRQAFRTHRFRSRTSEHNAAAHRLGKLHLAQNEAFTDIVCTVREENPLETAAAPSTLLA
jgi:hypothetical protein